MSWFTTESKNHPKELGVSQLRFLGEQDGPPERELKGRLSEFFRRDQLVSVAYLALVAYEDKSIAVALCLRSQGGPDRRVAEDIGRIFASMFGGHEHLDIVFLSKAQEGELMRVCQAFFHVGDGVRLP